MRRLYRYIFNLRSNKVTPIVFPNPRKKFDNCNCSICLENLIHDKVNLPCEKGVPESAYQTSLEEISKQ